ncbi:hypothetical protein DFH09DRAFT_1316657 [Mycena vulgaris]|nr:hypothetical protein DFH09DRAFT_1316657 [Mycena vulgaris]
MVELNKPALLELTEPNQREPALEPLWHRVVWLPRLPRLLHHPLLTHHLRHALDLPAHRLLRRGCAPARGALACCRGARGGPRRRAQPHPRPGGGGRVAGGAARTSARATGSARVGGAPTQCVLRGAGGVVFAGCVYLVLRHFCYPYFYSFPARFLLHPPPSTFFPRWHLPRPSPSFLLPSLPSKLGVPVPLAPSPVFDYFLFFPRTRALPRVLRSRPPSFPVLPLPSTPMLTRASACTYIFSFSPRCSALLPTLLPCSPSPSRAPYLPSLPLPALGVGVGAAADVDTDTVAPSAPTPSVLLRPLPLPSTSPLPSCSSRSYPMTSLPPPCSFRSPRRWR